ncbi:hypothetical protein ACJX0J_024233, partial [Zea mays]
LCPLLFNLMEINGGPGLKMNCDVLLLSTCHIWQHDLPYSYIYGDTVVILAEFNLLDFHLAGHKWANIHLKAQRGLDWDVLDSSMPENCITEKMNGVGIHNNMFSN